MKNKIIIINALIIIILCNMDIFICPHIYPKSQDAQNVGRTDSLTFVHNNEGKRYILRIYLTQSELNPDSLQLFYMKMFFSYDIMINNKIIKRLTGIAESHNIDPDTYSEEDPESDIPIGYPVDEYNYYFPDDSCHIIIAHDFYEHHRIKIIGDSCIKSNPKYKYLLTDVWFYEEKE